MVKTERRRAAPKALAPPDCFGGFGLHPQSGIATLTVLLQGATRYEDTTGATGVLTQGGLR